MTNKEAIEKIERNICGHMDWCGNRDCEKCEVELAIKALEKQIPKKAIFSHNLSDTLFVFNCDCGNTIKVSHDAGIMNNNNAANYCSKCGCRLDWEEEDV